jgi:HTH-type transcriptional regulator, quorum sensing regulator NprR
MATLGEKIKMLRTSLGLSQEQLAGKELTRSFISLVEKGKSTPSLQTLQIVARRLGKPVEFFMDDREDLADLEVIHILQESARGALEKRNWDQAVKHAMAAVHMAEKSGRIEVELEARWLLAEAYFKARRFEAAFGEYDGLYETYRTLGDRPGAVRALKHLGETCIISRDLVGAKRYFERALPFSQGLKTLQELRLWLFVDYGSCLRMLGNLDRAVDIYQQGLRECQQTEHPALWARLHWGLANSYQYAGNLSAALSHVEIALEWHRRTNHPDTVFVAQRYGIILGDLGRWEEARRVIQDCLLRHSNAGDLSRQASALIEEARYHLARSEPEAAIKVCLDALTLLDADDDADIRGRVYAMSALAYESMGRLHESLEACRVSAALLRQVKNGSDLQRVQAIIDRVRRSCAKGPESASSSSVNLTPS